MDLVSFTYECSGKEIIIKNPKYYNKDEKRKNFEENGSIDTMYERCNILDSYLVLGVNGSGKTTMLTRLSKIRSFKNKTDLIKHVEFYDFNSTNFFSDEECIELMDNISTILIKKDFDKRNYVVEVNGDKSKKIKMSDKILFEYIFENKKLLNFPDNREFCFEILSDDFGFDDRYIEINKIFELLRLDSKMRIIFLVFWGLYEYKIEEEGPNFNREYDDLDDTIYDLYAEKSSYKYCVDGIKKIMEKALDFSSEIIKNEDILNSMYLLLTDEAFENKTFKKTENNSLYIDTLKKCVSLLDECDNMFYLKDGNIVNVFFKISEVLKNYKFISLLLSLKINNTFIFRFKPDISSGERALIEITSCIKAGIVKLNKISKKHKVCYLLLDEIEQNLHPEWCRKLYTRIIEEINKVEQPYKFYLFISTHSPYIISDFTRDHIINLDDPNNRNEFQTFGANIHDILSKGMFLENPMGEYALSMIRGVHETLTSKKSKGEILKACGMDEKKLRYFIDSIGEPLIKMQLKQLWDNLEKEWNKDVYNTNEELYKLISSLSDNEKEKLIKELKGEVDVED